MGSVEFWILLAFVGAFALVARPLVRRTLAFLDARRSHVMLAFAEAEALREEAHRYLAQQAHRREGIGAEVARLEAQLATDLAALRAEAAASRAQILEARAAALAQRLRAMEQELIRTDVRAVVEAAEAVVARLLMDREDAALQQAWTDRGLQEIAGYFAER